MREADAADAAPHGVDTAGDDAAMVPGGARPFLAMGVVAWVGALLYGYVSGGNRLGPLTVGWWGGVGDHVGYSLLLGWAVTSFVVAAVLLRCRDGLDATRSGRSLAPPESAPGPSFGPPLFAAGATAIVIGSVVGWPFVAVGAGVVLAASVGLGSIPSDPKISPRTGSDPHGQEGRRATWLWRTLSGASLMVAVLSFAAGVFSDSEDALGMVFGIAGAAGAWSFAAIGNRSVSSDN